MVRSLLAAWCAVGTLPGRLGLGVLFVDPGVVDWRFMKARPQFVAPSVPRSRTALWLASFLARSVLYRDLLVLLFVST